LKRASDRLYAALTPAQWPARLAWALHPRADIRVDEETIAVPGASPRALRIAFASDFHAGAATPWPLIEAAVARLDELRADVLLLGGDFVSTDAAQARRVARLLGNVHAPFGRFAVLGNHDHWASTAAVGAHLRDAGIEVLTNRAVDLAAPFESVSVCGLDDHMSGSPDAARAFAGAGEIRVVLMHAPSGLLDIGDHAFTVAFCGHTHGGQIALTGGRPLVIAHGALSRQYNAGRYTVAPGRTLLVSRGVGCGTLPLRWNSPSSVFLCTLTRNSQ
jgi:predicted MPP superfamily phosphohydrolase